MWGLLQPGDSVILETEQKGAQPYRVRSSRNGRVTVACDYDAKAPGANLPTFVEFPQGAEVLLRKGSQERQAVVRSGGFDPTLGPARMRDGKDDNDRPVADCPWCWARDVMGERTGMAYGFAAGPGPVHAVPSYEHRCDGCGRSWTSEEWGALAQRFS